MNRETYEAIERMQVLSGQLSSLLGLVARSLDAEGEAAIDACAVLADNIANGLDAVPAFIEAQQGRYAGEGAAA